jgi:hypothetical protein
MLKILLRIWHYIIKSIFPEDLLKLLVTNYLKKSWYAA